MFPTTAISGESSESSYCQTLTSGNFVSVIYLQGISSAEEMELGRNVLSKIEEQTVQTPEISPADLLEMQEEQFSMRVEFGLMVAKVEGQKLSVCGRGKMMAKLVRKDKLVNLVEGTEEAAKKISGPLLHGDLLILGTNSFFSLVSPADFSEIENLPIDEIKEQLVSKVEVDNEKGKICAVFMKVDLKNESILNSESELELSAPAPQNPANRQIQPATSPQPVGTAPVSGISVGKALWPSLGEFLSKRGKWIPRRQNFEDPSSKRTLYLILIVFVVIVSFVAFQLRSKNLETNAKNIATIENSANEGISSASKLIGLNDQIARDSLNQTRKDVETQIENAYGADWKSKELSDKKKLEEILSKIDEQIGRVSHVYEISNLDTFYDFSLMKSEPKIISSNLHGGEIVSLDAANGSIYSLLTKNKAAELIIGKTELKKAKFLDFTPETLFVQTDEGIFQKNLHDSSEFKQIIKPSDKWGRVSGLSAFGGNLYDLDPTNNQIWKYQGTDLGFSDLVNYIKTGLPVDISSGTQMQVDGFVYVLSNGQIFRFAGGDVSDFTLSGIPDPILKVTAFFTSDETQNVYLWDADGKKVVVVDKKGVYQAEYKLGASTSSVKSKVLGASTQILADETVKKIFLLTDSQVFAIGIK